MFLQRTPFAAAAPRQPLVVAYSMGVDSTAMLIGVSRRPRPSQNTTPRGVQT
ncbi:MAG: hypothetical protein KY475_27260 [Planctomycetes bacterium]|nr:hypothetical protein [Planctomycetota bacterium]